MHYTRKQLKEANELVHCWEKEVFKSNPVAYISGRAIVLGMVVGISAGIGALAGLALSSASLSPLIAGGIIGSAAPLVFTIIAYCCYYGLQTTLQKKSEKVMFFEYDQILKEYSDSTEYKVKCCVAIISIGTSFGIGAGLVALGLTSPAAIGAITVIAVAAVCYTLNFLTDKAIECFFPEENKQPDSSVGDMKGDDTSRDFCPNHQSTLSI